MKTKPESTKGKKVSVPQPKACRIVLIDDHPLIRQGLSQLLNSQPTLTVAASAESAGEGIDMVRKHKPDLVILDLSLPKTDGLEVVKQLKSELPKLPMLVVSMHDESVYAERVLRAGARGYLMKKEPSEKIFEAIAHVLRGDIYVSDRVKRDMLESSVMGKRAGSEGGSLLDRLTDREFQVFQLLGNGITTKGIAQQLNLSVKTIETYRENLKVKLNLRTGADLVQRAIQWSKSQPD
ncbi:MAG TPA: response regulator transcription factor [Methylomirabilota bacterium]|nr:response regulator transcription factor [Methylomirabilota bacterium]